MLKKKNKKKEEKKKAIQNKSRFWGTYAFDQATGTLLWCNGDEEHETMKT